MIIFLDTSPLWLVAHPKGGSDAAALRMDLIKCQMKGHSIAVAEICNYEARRELIRKGTAAIRHLTGLDTFISKAIYVPLNSAAMDLAANLWATTRNSGFVPAPPEALDGDVILAAQATAFSDHIVATKNLSHLSRLCNAIDMANLSSLT